MKFSHINTLETLFSGVGAVKPKQSSGESENVLTFDFSVT